jgi:hypothetical protein
MNASETNRSVYTHTYFYLSALLPDGSPGYNHTNYFPVFQVRRADFNAINGIVRFHSPAK